MYKPLQTKEKQNVDLKKNSRCRRITLASEGVILSSRHIKMRETQ